MGRRRWKWAIAALLIPAWAGALGPGEMQSQAGLTGLDLRQGHRVMAEDQDLQVKLREELHQVVSERIVIIDHHQAHLPAPIKKSRPRSLGGFGLNITLSFYIWRLTGDVNGFLGLLRTRS